MKNLIAFLSAVPLLSSAACNPNPDLKTGPSGNVKIFLNYEHSGLSGFGESESSRPFPDPLPSEVLQQDRKGDPLDDRNTLTYFEPDGKAGWRPCRTETWWPSKEGNAFTHRYAANDPFLEKLARRFKITFAHRYIYDARGRIERVEIVDFNESPLRAEAESCNRYDEMDRLTLWVKLPKAKLCPKGEPAIEDDWRKFKYGLVKGATQLTFQQWHFPKKKELWAEHWWLARQDGNPTGFQGDAKAYGRYGVYQIEGRFLGKHDDNKANSALTAEGQRPIVSYVFTKPGTPLSVLENLEEVYKFDRRRTTRFDNVSTILEHFPAGSHVTRHRYFMLGPFALRDEQYDEKGKLTRIVTLFDDHPLGSWNDAKLPISDKIPFGHKVFHRVYDFDAGGKPMLVAVSWNKKFSLKRDIALPDATLVFGTPDGKQKWKNIFEFQRAFDTSENGHHVFKEPYDPSEREEQD